MHELLLDEEQSANLVDELVAVLLEHLAEAIRNQRSEQPHSRLNTKEAAKYLGLIPGTLSQWRASGDEKCPTDVKASGTVYYLRKHLDEWLATWNVDNSRPANSPHRFKRKIDLIPWEELQATYTRMIEDLERTGSDDPSVIWEIWSWRRKLQKAE